MKVFMSNYVKVNLTKNDIKILRKRILEAGYKIRFVPQNEWMLFAVDTSTETGGVYRNKHGRIALPKQIYNLLDHVDN